jgi:hypothetical protein
MKWLKQNRAGALVLAFFMAGSICIHAQDSAKVDLNLGLRYFMYNNKIPYVAATTNIKVKKKVQPVPGIEVRMYLDSVSADHLIAQLKTNDEGMASAPIPPALKTLWEASGTHKFMAVSAGNKTYEEESTDVEISKAKITLDTTTDGDSKSAKITVLAWKDHDWVPVKGVEVKVGVRRLGGFLTVDKDESYTTDSTGQFTAEFKRDSLPGDASGILTLVAKVDDHDQFGNLIVEKSVPWGVPAKAGIDFNKRTLFSTRDKAPVWLLFMAFTITFSVWAVLIYLIRQIILINKLGKNPPLNKT